MHALQSRQLSRGWAAALFAGFVTVGALQPPRHERPPTQPAWADVLIVATLLLLLVAFLALLAGRRWGFTPAAYGSGGFVLVSAVCPAWDHHQIGAWWVAQIGISVAMLVGSVIGRSAPPRLTVAPSVPAALSVPAAPPVSAGLSVLAAPGAVSAPAATGRFRDAR
ncbi:hypothetical protein [Parafrankia elaeagni]|uniref:hypothetical protein n=1 Tax=Parafrankia elaeagni TaxID=222534 RepID=UPI00037115A7|nr:hypothetical protein [Parafrankia elaeagni]